MDRRAFGVSSCKWIIVEFDTRLIGMLSSINPVYVGPFVVIHVFDIGCPTDQMSQKFEHVIGDTKFLEMSS